MQIFAIVVSLALTVGAVALLVPAVQKMLGVIRNSQPAPGRTDNPVGRGLTMLKETFLHTRMLQWHWIGIMHWFVYMAFLFLSTAVLAAYFQLFKPDFAWPIVGHWHPFEWFSEFIGLLSTIGIIVLIVYRQMHHPKRDGRKSRFYGSTMWQAYFVEYLALLEGSAILFVRGAEWKLDEHAGRSHYPIASWIGDALYPVSVSSLENLIYGIAAFKIALAMIWLMVIARNITMGIAWHRFTAWFNIFFKRESDGSTALGAMKPLTSGGRAITLDDIDDLDEDSVLGVGSIEDFSWKGILDFTTCTECGRCQSQCPAWNTEKPLSPKLLMMGLRDHAYEKAANAPAAEGAVAVADKSLIGSGAGAEPVKDWFYNPEGADYVIDEDVLWSCTSCGACVQQCPVDIEHVDHIMDMRRYQVLVESNFPAELNALFKGLENKGNPWNMSATARMDWAKGLEFDVPVVGEDLESLESVDWLFWVGCAGAYEDRAKKTTRAVAELLNIAGISFGVLGNGETCTGDPARRAGNEFVFQGLAAQNVETFKEFKVKKVVSTCAHCFNTLKNEYKDFGIELEVVHHTQLLNRLVRDGKLTPVKDGAGAAKRSITYHDPCYLGRHNEVYSPPRELLQVLPGAEYVEMERHSEKSFCCGAGGARMWMEENIGERINVNRTREAVGTGADQIAVGCPFCRVMLSDGLTAQQASGEAREEVEVLDVAQMLLASVKGEQATKAAPGSSAAAAAGTAKAAVATTDVATKDEPEAGDVTVTEDTITETADAGPAAKASGGSSLFDTPAPAEETPAPAAGGSSLFDTPAPEAPAPAASGGSLFDTPAPAETPKAESGSLFDTPAPAEAPKAESGSLFDTPAPAEAPKAESGSLFDIPTPEAPAESAEPAVAAESPSDSGATEPAEAKPATDLGAGGSLFDLAAPEAPVAAESPSDSSASEAPTEPTVAAESPSDSSASEAPAEAPVAAESPSDSSASEAPTEPTVAAESPSDSSASTPSADLGSGGSLFDIAAPTPAAATPAPAPESAPEPEPEPEPAAEEAEDPETILDSDDSPEETQVEPAEPEPEPAAAPSAPPTGADLSQAATFAAPADAVTEAAAPADEASDVDESGAADEDPDTILDSDDADEAAEAAQDDAEDDAAEKPKPATAPASRGEAHTPRTDVDINESSSLFDL